MIYIYIRMSHRQSADSGISEAHQLAACMSYATSLRINPTFGKQKYPEDMPNGVFCDRAHSAWKNKLADRPAGAALLSVLKPGDEVIFYNVERAYRTVVGFCQETELLLQKGISPHFVSNNLDFSSATGRMIGRILAVIAEYYSDMISERTKEALAIKRALGTVGKQARKTTPWEMSSVYVPKPKSKIILPCETGVIRSYIRCSHETSTASGLGLEQQRRANREYAKRIMAENPGLTFHEELYEDQSVSAFHNPLHLRPAGAKLLADLQPGDHVLFYRCDRGFRTPYDCALTAKQFEKDKISMHLVDCGINSSSAMGRLYIHLLAIFGSLESEIKSRRNKEITDKARSDGRPIGKVPFHCNVIEKDGKRKLEYDFDKVVICAVCWILRKLGYTFERIGVFASRMVALQKNLRVGTAHKKKLTVDEQTAKMRFHRWEELAENMPVLAVKEALETAIDLLESPLPPKLAKNCKHLSLPMVNIRGRLADAGISLGQTESTQAQAQSANIPA